MQEASVSLEGVISVEELISKDNHGQVDAGHHL